MGLPWAVQTNLGQGQHRVGVQQVGVLGGGPAPPRATYPGRTRYPTRDAGGLAQARKTEAKIALGDGNLVSAFPELRGGRALSRAARTVKLQPRCLEQRDHPQQRLCRATVLGLVEDHGDASAAATHLAVIRPGSWPRR